ncbi:unnamed protein product [Aphanomyces euteiches]
MVGGYMFYPSDIEGAVTTTHKNSKSVSFVKYKGIVSTQTMGLGDHKTKPSPALSSLTKATRRPSVLTNQELEQLRIDLEDILHQYEPHKVGSATDLLKQYEGLELELVECYRYYYTKNGEPLELVLDVERSTLCNNQTDAQASSSFSQTLRKRLSLPKPAIATYLNAKLLAKFRKSHGKPSGSKMEGIRGPEVPPPPAGSPKRGFRVPSKASLANLVNRVRGSKDSNPFEVKPRSHYDNERQAMSTQTPYEVRCLDTGESMTMDRVNQQVLQQKREFTWTKRKSFRDKIIVFLERYDMAAVDDIDAILNYGGKTNEEIWDELQAKYQVNQRSRLLQLFQKFDPPRVPDVDFLLQDYADQVEEMIAYYKNKYADKRRAEQVRQDPCTWSPGQANSYQLLPGGQ